VHRIQPLLAGVHAEDGGQLLRHRVEEKPVELLLGQQLPHGPQSPQADVLPLVGFVGKIEGVVPFGVEGQLPHGFLVGCVMHRLELEGRPRRA